MHTRVLGLLEFDKIFTLLKNECFSAEGIKLLGNQKFFFNREQLSVFQETVGQLKQYLDSEHIFPDVHLPSLSVFIEKMEKPGALLEGNELYRIAEFCTISRQLKHFFTGHEIPDTPRVISLVSEMADLKSVADMISSTIDTSGNVRENHPLLKKMRNDLKELTSRMSVLTAGYMNESKDIWQSDVPTVRDGRIVLPLKANYRGRVKGIIHTVSAKGATVFIEPFDILDLNNKITIKENEIVLTIRKILKELTGAVALHNEELILLSGQTAYLDTLVARARFSIRHHCVRAETGGPVKLKKARHLLLGDNAVPIDVDIKTDLHALILTGPNAGGKTVTLKTVGLFALMNQFGMDIPAEEGSMLDVFDSVYADIGDDQSMENSLSTFSAHMKNISFIVQNATENSLVLLDEIGSGTDPAEGVAIAMAVLDNLVEKKCIVLTTSHHGLLKNYGYTRPHVSNASMEFDSFSHTPTYRIIFGMPGESHAIEIAKRSGIPEKIIEQSEQYLHSKQNDISEMIKELEKKQRELFEREKQLREEIRKYDLKVLELKQKEYILKKEGYGELNKFMLDSRKSLENLVKELREGEITKEKTRKVKQFISRIEEKTHREEISIPRFTDEKTAAAQGELKEGMDVEIGTFRRPGKLLRREKKDTWLVSVGAVKMSFPVSDIHLVTRKAPVKNSYSVSISRVLSDNHPVFILDIRGLRAEEAITKVTKQLDNAIMSGMREFVIVHGKGEGALSRIVSDILGASRNVLEFSFARPEEGGAGKTIVRLRE